MIIEWSPNFILLDWVKKNRWHRSVIQGVETYKITIIEPSYLFVSDNGNYKVHFWDELKFMNELYQIPPNLSIEEIKMDVDQFLLRMKEMKAFV